VKKKESDIVESQKVVDDWSNSQASVKHDLESPSKKNTEVQIKMETKILNLEVNT
jgi:hypothetical protein